MDWLAKASTPFKNFYLFSIVSLLTFLTACGGGGFNETTDPTNPTTPTSDVTTVTVSISSTNIDAANPATVTATVSSSTTGPVVGSVVTFTTSLGVLNPSSGTALTDANGQATIQIQAGTIAGAGEVSASIGTGEFGSVGFTSAGDGTDIPGKTVFLTSTSTDITSTAPATLTATVTNAGAAVVGELVTFTTTLGALDPVSGTALTDANGQATITLTAGSVAGAGVVTARLPTNEFDSVGFNTAGDVVSNVTVSLELTDLNGIPLNPRQISSTTPGKIQATVTGISSPVIVSFATDLGSIPIPTAITDSNNIATVDIFASNSLGAGTVIATLVSGENAQMVFSIGASSLGIGTSTLDASNQPDNQIEIPAGAIAAGGTTTLSVTLWDTSVTPPIPFTDAVDVSFSSDCSNLATPTAELDTVVTTVNGVANSTYRAEGCEGDDNVTATANAGGVALSATGIVSINSANIGSIQFVSATPENISLQGVGGTESSTVLFRVLDESGDPEPNVLVDFTTSTTVGGLSITPTSATTNGQGFVQTVVNSGTITTPVRITATVNGVSPTIATQSSVLVISTGIPDQDSFSLSADILNPEAWNIDGNTVQVTARLADAFNNPVPDGTAVSFVTEGGSIESSCTTTDGACSVTWTSQNARPDGQTLAGNGASPEVSNTLGQSFGGRATILAYAIGNESFPDLNGNGVYDASEEAAFAGNDINGVPFDLDEAFRDYNEDGVFGTGGGSQPGGELEEFVDFNVDSSHNLADGEYNGVLCGDATNCSAQESINVRGSIVLVMSGSNPEFVTTTPAGGADLVIMGDGTNSASIIIADLHNQPMPAGTEVEFSTTVGSIVSQSTFIWPNDNHNGGRAFSVTVKGQLTPITGSLIAKVTTPSGLETSYTVCVVDIQ